MTDHQPHSRAALAQRFGRNYRWLVLLTVMVGTMASIMASTIINVAVPEMSEVFKLGQERAQWLSAAFMAAMTLSMLMTPWLLDRFGYRHTYLGAVLFLLAGGIVGGLSPWFELVLGVRVAQGLAAGVLQPIPAIIVMRAFGAGEQGKAMGVFGFGVVLAPALGPTVGGVLVEWFGWRSIFFIVVPFSLLALWLARRYLPIGAPGGGPINRAGARIDLIGVALMAVAVLTLLNGMVCLHGDTPSLGLALLAGTAAAIAAFVWHERRTAQPLMDLRLFSDPVYSAGAIVSFIYGMGLFGSTYLLPVFMQMPLGISPSASGAVMLPAGLMLAGTIALAGRMADRQPVSRMVATGLVLLALSFLLMVGVDLGTSIWWIVAWAVVGRIGLGFVLPSLNVGAMRGLPDTLISQAASNINFMRQLGGAVGISLVGIVLEWRIQAEPATPVHAFHETFVLVGLIMACAVIAALRMRPPHEPRH
jgi:EmrB/QacA subfamily drug resistance transporter